MPQAHPLHASDVAPCKGSRTTICPPCDELSRLRAELQDARRGQRELRQRNALLEARTHRLRHLALALTQAEQRDRRRLAQLLHDHLQQLLVGAKFSLGVLKSRAKGQKRLAEGLAELSDVVDEAIDASRALTHQISPPVLYQAGLADALAWLARQIESEYGLSVTVTVRGEVEPTGEPVRVFLFSAVRELLHNIVRHADARQAELTLERTNGHLRIHLADDGVGFDPAGLEAAQGEGGFGLLGIRERIGLLDGEFTVQAAPGQGSRFILRTPIGPAPREPARPSTNLRTDRRPHRSRRSTRAERIRVLLADDHRVMRTGLATLLAEEPDIEIVGQADNGVQALELARALQPDVIVMDVSMPLMDGVEATRCVKSELPAVRIIGLSTFEAAEMARRVLQAGAAAYLNKSGPSDELLQAIRGG